MCEPLTLAAVGGTLAGAASTSAAVMGAIGATALSTGSAIALGATVGSGLLSAMSAYQQGQVMSQVGRNNQILAEQAAKSAQRAGDEQVSMIRRQASLLKGQQRATMAARNLDLTEGTAQELQDQADFFEEYDVATARQNTANEVARLRSQGAMARAEGVAGQQQANMTALASLMGTGGKVADRWYR